MLYPVPAVMVSCADKEGRSNIITVAWAGTVCSSPAMVSISIRPERFSYHMIRETGEFVVNLTTSRQYRMQGDGHDPPRFTSHVPGRSSGGTGGCLPAGPERTPGSSEGSAGGVFPRRVLRTWETGRDLRLFRAENGKDSGKTEKIMPLRRFCAMMYGI